MATHTISEGHSTILYGSNAYQAHERPPSRTLMISSNLIAALEFDERIRGPSSPTHTFSGLPPPPRAKNGGTKARSSTIGSVSTQPLQHIPANLPSNPSAWNPYINPKPVLMREEPDATRPHPASAPTSPVSSHTTHTFTPQRAPTFDSATQAESSGSGHRVHRRYLSALPKVDWFLGKGVLGKRGDGGPGKKIERHESCSEPSRIKPIMREKPSTQGVFMLPERVMATTSGKCF
ncbi:hypothetical protein BXZ70DRAFT_210954 [Cristinia sonorae]|uniref:Uncharacterized protein n=1 Tax=Cristinia sonorae TaxID=1940300 RepID=A0A8K0ULT3_9AGAR|nr:hypothetical protein BXZ70DRAFT_210954 [Cristinia sonorae]